MKTKRDNSIHYSLIASFAALLALDASGLHAATRRLPNGRDHRIWDRAIVQRPKARRASVDAKRAAHKRVVQKQRATAEAGDRAVVETQPATPARRPYVRPEGATRALATLPANSSGESGQRTDCVLIPDAVIDRHEETGSPLGALLNGVSPEDLLDAIGCFGAGTGGAGIPDTRGLLEQLLSGLGAQSGSGGIGELLGSAGIGDLMGLLSPAGGDDDEGDGDDTDDDEI